MNDRIVRRAMGLAVLLVAAAACGPTPTTPTSPSVSTLTPLLLPRVGGLWDGALTFTRVSGGTGIVHNAGLLECVGSAFATVVGESNQSQLQITQTGLKVEGQLTSSDTGLSCSYTGSIGANGGMVLAAAACSEVPLAIVVRCPPDSLSTAVRQLVLVGSTLTADLNAPVNVTEVSGSAAHTYNILDASGDPVGGLVANHAFTLSRR